MPDFVNMYQNNPKDSALQTRPRANTSAATMSTAGGNDPLTYCIPSQVHRLTFEFSLEDHIKKTRKAAAYLKQLLHSRECMGCCNAQSCMRTTLILRHVLACSTNGCSVSGCLTTKALLEHESQCGNLGGATSATLGHFCLLCTIATVQCNRNRLPSYDSNNFISFGQEDRFAPLINDEIIEFSKVPFQQRSPSHEHDHTGRSKTYSESHVLLALDQPSKKMRGKSLDAFPLSNTVVPTSSQPAYVQS
jgi:hypothetical protein